MIKVPLLLKIKFSPSAMVHYLLWPRLTSRCRHPIKRLLTVGTAPETSPGKKRYFLAYIRRIYIPAFLFKFWALKILAFSPHRYASYAISVRRTSDLPAASFRFHLTVDTLAVRLTLPLDGRARDLHPRVSKHAGRTSSRKKTGGVILPFSVLSHHRTYGSVYGGS